MSEASTQIGADGKRHPVGTGPTDLTETILRVAGTPSPGDVVVIGPDGYAVWQSGGGGGEQEEEPDFNFTANFSSLNDFQVLTAGGGTVVTSEANQLILKKGTESGEKYAVALVDTGSLGPFTQVSAGWGGTSFPGDSNLTRFWIGMFENPWNSSDRFSNSFGFCFEISNENGSRLLAFSAGTGQVQETVLLSDPAGAGAVTECSLLVAFSADEIQYIVNNGVPVVHTTDLPSAVGYLQVVTDGPSASSYAPEGYINSLYVGGTVSSP